VGVRDNEQVWVISCYFNWQSSYRKRANLEVFRKQFRDHGIPLLVVECAFGSKSFELEGNDVFHVRSEAQLWQKERLLNLACEQLPAECEYVAWMDCDLLLQLDQWSQRVRSALAASDLVQLFSTAFRFAQDNTIENPLTRIDRGLVACMKHRGETVATSKGHPGFAWAARREYLHENRFYDAGIVGGGDKMMLYAWCGIAYSSLVQAMTSAKSFAHYSRWAERVTQSGSRLPRLTYLPGSVHHLWHGEQKHRRYNERYAILKVHDFDPLGDLRDGMDGCWEWTGSKPQLETAVAEYFAGRHEDGDGAESDDSFSMEKPC
jgi:hypothetical protein